MSHIPKISISIWERKTLEEEGTYFIKQFLFSNSSNSIGTFRFIVDILLDQIITFHIRFRIAYIFQREKVFAYQQEEFT